jgi:phosphotransacetylase
VLDPSATVRRVINMTAFSVVEAQKKEKKKPSENKVAE